MPLYEYRCTKCGHQVEVLQKISDRPRRRCGECSGKLEKLISRTSFQLKGGGWYAQGYGGSSGDKGSGGNGSAPKPSSSTKDSGSSTTDSSSTPESDSKSSAATA